MLYSGNVSQVRRLTVELVANGMLQSAINQTDAHIRIVWSQSGTDGLWFLPKQGQSRSSETIAYNGKVYVIIWPSAVSLLPVGVAFKRHLFIFY